MPKKENREGDRLAIPAAEFRYSFSRSQGPGGQNVNKVSTKVTIHWNFSRSKSLTPEQRRILANAPELRKRVTPEGVLFMSDQSTRSQAQNRERVTRRLERLVAKVFRVKKRRIKTAPTRRSRERRLREKHRQQERKRERKNTNW